MLKNLKLIECVCIFSRCYISRRYEKNPFTKTSAHLGLRMKYSTPGSEQFKSSPSLPILTTMNNFNPSLKNPVLTPNKEIDFQRSLL